MLANWTYKRTHTNVMFMEPLVQCYNLPRSASTTTKRLTDREETNLISCQACKGQPSSKIAELQPSYILRQKPVW